MKVLEIHRNSAELPPIERVTLTLEVSELAAIIAALLVVTPVRMRRGLSLMREWSRRHDDPALREKTPEQILKHLDADGPLWKSLMRVLRNPYDQETP